MKMQKGNYRSQNWRIHNIASDFELHDCWLLPIKLSESKKSFYEVFEFIISFDPSNTSLIVEILFKLRFVVGSVMKWDGTDNWDTIPDTQQRSLTERLTKSDHNHNQIHRLKRPSGFMGEFKPVYLFENEGLVEISNQTIFALLHIGQTEDGSVALGVFVKYRGLLSHLYMAMIKPFRYLVVYPAWFSSLEIAWQARFPASARRGADIPQL